MSNFCEKIFGSLEWIFYTHLSKIEDGTASSPQQIRCEFILFGFGYKSHLLLCAANSAGAMANNKVDSEGFFDGRLLRDENDAPKESIYPTSIPSSVFLMPIDEASPAQDPFSLLQRSQNL